MDLGHLTRNSSSCCTSVMSGLERMGRLSGRPMWLHQAGARKALPPGISHLPRVAEAIPDNGHAVVRWHKSPRCLL